MATFYAVTSALVEEVRERIQDLTPTYEPSMRFHSLGDDPEAQLYDIEELEIQPRQFDIGPGVRQGRPYFGGNVMAATLEYPIRINYPGGGTERWRAAVLSDAHKIEHDLGVNQTTASGVQARWVVPESAIIIEESDEDDTIRLEITMRAVLEYTG